MSFRRHAIVLIPVMLISACSEQETPVEPVRSEAAVAISTHVAGIGGLPGFSFGPPIVTGPAMTSGEFDASLLELLAVEICEWTGTGCVMPVIRRITTTARLPERLRLDDDGQHYLALWNTRRDDLDPAKAYRIRVLASGQQIGYADIDVVENSSDVARDGRVRLVAGSTLPVAFRIEEGLGVRAGSAGGVIALADGQVALELPEGALDEDVLITAVPATDLPPDGPPVVPGTAWDFGPDGLAFAEPVTLTVTYDPADLPPGTDESELRIHKLVDGTFVQQDAGTIDIANNTASALVDGFSVFVLLTRLFPGSPEDVQAPVVQSIEVFDAASGTFGSAVTLQTSSADATLRTRLGATDDISGVSLVQIDYVSPSGRQIRFPCWPFPTDPPIAGSDTNGLWECESTWPRFAEAGVWRPNILFVRDAVGNFASFRNRPEGFCDGAGPDVTCLVDMPEITVSSDPTDTNPPVLLSLDVSLDSQPRSFASSISVDASTSAQGVVFRFHATDDLSGIEPRSRPHERFLLTFSGPSGQSLQGTFCVLASGTDLDGFWECPMTVPLLAEPGSWGLTRLQVPDRVGNGGRAGLSYFTPDGTGRLCNPDGNCVAAPTVEVTGIGDSEAPFLQSVGLEVMDATVTATVAATDDLIGVNEVVVQYNSATTTQSVLCFGALVGGDVNDGTWSCSITFEEFSALGEWNLSFLTLADAAGNRRRYRRRDTDDGFLCYSAPTGEVCEDLGETDVIVQ